MEESISSRCAITIVIQQRQCPNPDLCPDRLLLRSGVPSQSLRPPTRCDAALIRVPGLLDRHSHEPRPRASVLEYPNSLSPQVSSSAPQEPRNPPFPPADAWPGDPTSRLPGTTAEDDGRLSSLHRFLCAWCQACDFELCNLQDIREAAGTAGLRTPSTPPAFITSFSVWHWECR